MAGVDYVAKTRRVDLKRLGVTGYSYGGFLTNWVITQTPRFAAAISGAGISNWISDYATSDIRVRRKVSFSALRGTECARPPRAAIAHLLRRMS